LDNKYLERFFQKDEELKSLKGEEIVIGKRQKEGDQENNTKVRLSLLNNQNLYEVIRKLSEIGFKSLMFEKIDFSESVDDFKQLFVNIMETQIIKLKFHNCNIPKVEEPFLADNDFPKTDKERILCMISMVN
jgi:hypothetical protein